MIQDSKLREELEWKKDRFHKNERQLEGGEIVEKAIPSAYGRLGMYAQDIGICQLLLKEDDPEQWFRRSAAYLIEKIDKVDEYADVIEDANQWHRPTNCHEALNAAIIASDDDLIDGAIQRTYAIDREWLLDSRPDFAHVLYYALALAAYLDDDPDACRDWLSEHPEELTDDTKYEGLYDALEAILDEDDETLQTAIQQVLVEHRKEYGPDTETAVGFVSVDAMVSLVLARDAGLEIDTEAIDSELTMFLPERLPA